MSWSFAFLLYTFILLPLIYIQGNYFWIVHLYKIVVVSQTFERTVETYCIPLNVWKCRKNLPWPIYSTCSFIITVYIIQLRRWVSLNTYTKSGRLHDWGTTLSILPVHAFKKISLNQMYLITNTRFSPYIPIQESPSSNILIQKLLSATWGNSWPED